MIHRFAVLVLFAALLVACGNQSGTPAGGATQPTAASQGSGTDAPKAADLGGRTLSVGSDTAYPPFEYVDENNAIVGFDVDMLTAVCARINCKVEFKTAAFDTIFAALANGEYDLVASAVTITPERAERVAFSRPYLNAGQIVSIRADDSTIAGADALKGKKVGVQRGTTGDIEAVKYTEDANINRYDTIDLAMAALAQGDIDAVIADAPTSGDIINKQFKDRLKTVGNPFTTEYYGIAIRKETPEITEAINAALGELQASGELGKIAEKWGIPANATQNLPESGLGE